MTDLLWTGDLLAALAANGKSSAAGIARDGKTPDHVPLLKLFTPGVARRGY